MSERPPVEEHPSDAVAARASRAGGIQQGSQRAWRVRADGLDAASTRRPQLDANVDTPESVLRGTWHFASTAPGAFASASAFFEAHRNGTIASSLMNGACTIAAALAQRDTLDMDAPPDLDGQDWWVWCVRTDDHASGAAWLVCDGLASIVDVWWNDCWLGRTSNMFVPWRAEVTTSAGDVLAFCARAMSSTLTPRRPRARWRSRLVESQEWRWHRTTHLGRMPGVGPRIPPVGPWQPVRLIPVPHATPAWLLASDIAVRPTCTAGVSTLTVTVRGAGGTDIERAWLECGDVRVPIDVTSADGAYVITGALTTDAFAVWWPHTHGTPHTYAATVHAHTAHGQFTLPLGRVGFREITIDRHDGGFGVQINACDVFLRGTCWVPADWVHLESITAQFARDLPLLLSAGINCIRFSGAFTYPTADMLALCDAHGLTVWHDLMFSVLDYPHTDDAFNAEVTAEAQYVANRAAAHASVVVLCGNSEVEQQATMMGIALADVPHPLFRTTLPAAVSAVAPSLFYWPGTPHDGATPMQLTTGTAHYFGVGAYRRALSDARQAGVRFATECLAFSHLAEPESPSAIVLPAASAGAAWHVHINKDGGAAWDFADIRDFYSELLFGARAAPSSDDVEGYAAYGRAATAFAIERSFVEWRRADSATRGALTWLWRDPWRGAGWGMVDHDGYPKSSWYAIRRASRARAVAITDDGLDGATVHCWNDAGEAVDGVLTVRLLRANGEVIDRCDTAVPLAARQSAVLPVSALFGRFMDATQAYQFGQLPHEFVHAAWTSADGSDTNAELTDTFEAKRMIGDAILAVGGASGHPSAALMVQATRVDDQRTRVRIQASAVVLHVRLGARGWVASDGYFALTPGVERHLAVRRSAFDASDTMTIESMPGHGSVILTMPRTAGEPSGR